MLCICLTSPDCLIQKINGPKKVQRNFECYNRTSLNKETQEKPRNNPTMPDSNSPFSQLRNPAPYVCFKSSFCKIVVISRSLCVGLQLSGAVRRIMHVPSFLSINILDVTGTAQNVKEIDGVIQTGQFLTFGLS